MNTENEIRYWKIEYISCEGNERWTVVTVPQDWYQGQVESTFLATGSYGDEPAEIISCTEVDEVDDVTINF